MITKKVVLTVQGENSILSDKIVMFKADDGIRLNFNIKQSKYKFDKDPEDLVNLFNAQKASILILRPNKSSFTTEIINIVNNTVTFDISRNMIDEQSELGEYKLQIHLYDKDNNRLTIPPVSFFVKDTI